MVENSVKFVTLMKNAKKLDIDTMKIDKILTELKKNSPRFKPEVKMFWAVSPEADKDLALFYQSLERPVIRMVLEKSDHMLQVKQVLLNKDDLEQERFLTEGEKSDIKGARFEDNKVIENVESEIRGVFRDLESYSQDEDFILETMNILEENRARLKNFDSTAIEEIRNEIGEALNILREMEGKNTVVIDDVKGLMKKMLVALEGIRPLVLDKGNAEAYKTELTLRGNEQALSNILVASMAEKDPGIYINLDAFSLNETNSLVEQITRNVRNGINFNRAGAVNYIRSNENNREHLQIVNRERNERYKLLLEQIPNLKPSQNQSNMLGARENDVLKKRLGRLDLGKDTPIRLQNSTIIDIYNRGHLVSNFTGKALVEDIESLQRSQRVGFFARIKNFFKSLFRVKNKVSAPGKSHLIVYSDEKSRSEAEQLYKKNPKTGILYKYDPIENELTFIKAGGVKDERELRFDALYKRRGFDNFTSYGEVFINPGKVSKLLSETGIPLRNNILTPLEEEAMNNIKTHLRDDIDIFHLLPEALEQSKKQFPGIDHKKIARHLLEEKGEKLFAGFKNDVINPGVNGKDEFGAPPLCMVAGSKELVEILIEDYQADVNIKNRQGLSPAFMAASLGKVDNLKSLEQNGADLHVKDHKGNNVLYELVEGDHVPGANRDLTNTIHYLLERGVDPNEKNKSGKSAADLAIEKSKYDLVELFDPSNFSVEVYNALSPETKEFFKSALDEHLNSRHQEGSRNNVGNEISEDIDEPDYATVEELGILNEDTHRVETPSVTHQDLSDEPIYVDPGEIRLNKELGRLTKMADNFLDEMSSESGYDSYDENNIDENNAVNQTKLDMLPLSSFMEKNHSCKAKAGKLKKSIK